MPAADDNIDAEVEQYLLSQSPFDRVKRLYQVDPRTTKRYAESRQCNSIAFVASTIVGSIVFAFAASEARENYLRSNTHTIHKTRWLANRRAADAYVLGGLKKGSKWFLISAAAVSAFSHLAQAIELYRLKTSVANYALSGAVLGGVSRVLLGPRGMLAGAFIGCYAGTLAGYSVTSAMSYRNITVEERFYEQVKTDILADRFYEQHSTRISEQLKSLQTSDSTQTSKSGDIRLREKVNS